MNNNVLKIHVSAVQSRPRTPRKSASYGIFGHLISIVRTLSVSGVLLLTGCSAAGDPEATFNSPEATALLSSVCEAGAARWEAAIGVRPPCDHLSWGFYMRHEESAAETYGDLSIKVDALEMGPHFDHLEMVVAHELGHRMTPRQKGHPVPCALMCKGGTALLEAADLTYICNEQPCVRFVPEQ